jgi:glutathione S-transferase
LEWNFNEFRPASFEALNYKLKETYHSAPFDPEVYKGLCDKSKAIYEELESKLSKCQSGYLVGDNYSLADL